MNCAKLLLIRFPFLAYDRNVVAPYALCLTGSGLKSGGWCRLTRFDLE